MSNHGVSVIVPAGGRGRRMHSEVPKQYLPLDGKPILWHTLRFFERSQAVRTIVLVLHPADEELCNRVVLQRGEFNKVLCVVPGGVQRHESVEAGLKAIEVDDEIVVVHDAVRPFASDVVFSRVVEAARVYGAAVPVVAIRDTVKQTADGRVVATLPRDQLGRAQTPQAFRRIVLLEAHERWAAGRGPTDDAGMVEALGHPVQVVEGDENNIKITTPGDLAWAEWYARNREGDQEQRSRISVGQGVDVHALVEGRDLILGGVHVPFALGLAGHSDADVLTHAIIDALLGATGKGDIGQIFPDTDPQYKDISSMLLLHQVIELLGAEGVTVCNVDTVLMAQRPRLSPYVDEISQKLAAAMLIDPSQVSVKATTTESLGFVGRQEGMMAQAIALVEVRDSGGR